MFEEVESEEIWNWFESSFILHGATKERNREKSVNHLMSRRGKLWNIREANSWKKRETKSWSTKLKSENIRKTKATWHFTDCWCCIGRSLRCRLSLFCVHQCTLVSWFARIRLGLMPMTVHEKIFNFKSWSLL